MSASFLCTLPCEGCQTLISRWVSHAAFVGFVKDEEDRWRRRGHNLDQLWISLERRIFSVAFQREHVTLFLDSWAVPLHVKLRIWHLYPEQAEHRALTSIRDRMGWEDVLRSETARLGPQSPSAQDLIAVSLFDPHFGIPLWGYFDLTPAWRQALRYLATLPDYPHLVTLWRQHAWLRDLLAENAGFHLQLLADPTLTSEELDEKGKPT